MKHFLSAAALAIAASVATNPALAKKEPDPKEARAPSEAEAARILAWARGIRDKKGCAEAAPAYRVVAGMGEGFEPAQHELGECLTTVTGSSPEETALFREEALFWLKRAAYAGNARAQRALSILYGAADSAVHSPADALKWALIYDKNGDADLYGYKALPPTYVPGLKNDLGAEDVAAAEAFAASFALIKLGAYAGPPRPKFDKGGPAGFEGAGPGGERPRRRPGAR